MASTLRQELFLGVLPAGLQFSITEAAVFANPGGYNVTWRDTTNFNVSNMDGRCFNAGNSFPPREPARNPGKTCVKATRFSATISGGQPVRLGEMTWARANTLDIFAQGVPGWIELRFQISKASGGALATGTTAEPKPRRLLWLLISESIHQRFTLCSFLDRTERLLV